MKFIDEVIVEVTSGHGGKGCTSFRREKYIPRGGPDGGNGGKGGDVVFKSTHNMTTLLDFHYKKKITANNGQAGMGSGCDGRAANDEVVLIPVGTALYDFKTKDLLFDFTEADQTYVAAKGGRGGKGNAYFVTSTKQAPLHSQPGEDGNHLKIRLELKLLADVALIGLPNAGKSTFLTVVSKARPKVADYPFTTLSPCLGVVAHGRAKPFVIADLPGLIEGASHGKGMGDKFLKHAERTRLLVHLVRADSVSKEEVLKNFKLIQKEVKAYFGKRKKTPPMLTVLSQCDLLPSKELNLLKKWLTTKIKAEVFMLSSVTRMGVDKLLDRVVKEWESP